jgi:hypothetical protein
MSERFTMVSFLAARAVSENKTLINGSKYNKYAILYLLTFKRIYLNGRV